MVAILCVMTESVILVLKITTNIIIVLTCQNLVFHAALVASSTVDLIQIMATVVHD